MRKHGRVRGKPRSGSLTTNYQPINYKKIPSFTLALHGWSQKVSAEDLLPMFREYFAAAGLAIHEVDIRGVSPEDLKSVSGRTIQKRLSTGEFHGLSTLNAYHFIDRGNKASEDFFIGFSDDHGDQHACFINAITDETGHHETALCFLRDILSFVSPAYGYSLELPLGHDPYLFSLGMFGRTEHIEVESMAWQDASHAQIKGDLHRRGRFRHVFAINVLSPPHLENHIDGRTFEDWVRYSGFGSLAQWKSDVWVWQIPREYRIRVAHLLRFNGLLIAPEGFENQLIG